MLLISGSSGFIGSNLKIILKSKKIKFKVIKTREIKSKNKNFFKGIKYFIHLGFNFHKKKTILKNDSNLNIIKFLIKKAEDYNFKIIFASTASYKYRGKNKIISHDIYPFNLYSLSKINCEKLLKKSFKAKKTDITILRIFNVYGNNQSKGWLIPDLIRKFLSRSKKNIKLVNYLNTRDFIHVEDVCRAIVGSLKLSGFNILNIGTSVETKIVSVAKIILKELKSKKKIILSNPLSKKNNLSKADIKKTKKILKWSSKIRLKSGLKKVIKYELFKKRS